MKQYQGLIQQSRIDDFFLPLYVVNSGNSESKFKFWLQNSLRSIYIRDKSIRETARRRGNIHRAKHVVGRTTTIVVDRSTAEFADASLRDFTQPVTRGNATPRRSTASLVRPTSSCFAPLVILPPPRARVLPGPRVQPRSVSPRDTTEKKIYT